MSNNLSQLFDAIQGGFTQAYEEHEKQGFNPESPVQKDTKERVLAAIAGLRAVYGNFEIPNTRVAAYAALDLYTSLNDVLIGFESLVNSTPEDFEKAEELFSQSIASSYGTTQAGTEVPN